MLSSPLSALIVPFALLGLVILAAIFFSRQVS